LEEFTLFHTPYGISSGPGADWLLDFPRALAISSGRIGAGGWKGDRFRGGGVGSLGGKKWPKRECATSSDDEQSGRDGKRVWGFPKANFLAVQTLWGVAVERKSAQWVRFAFLMAEKYSFLLLAISWREAGVCTLRCSLAELWKVLRSLVRVGDHQGFDLGDGLLGGVLEVRMNVRRVDEASNHRERELGVTREGRGSVL
jgi:hypothetical protein